MLKYSIKLVTTPELNPINYSELYLAKDLSYISGVTDYYEGIRDGEEVSVSSPYLANSVRRPIKLTLVRRQGYVLTEEKYPIEKIENVGDEKEDVYYVEYNGDYYYLFDNFSVEGFLIDGFLRPSNVGNTVTIPTKHWIENGKVEIKGERYYVDTNLIKNEKFNNGYEYPTIKKYGDNSILEKVDGTEIKVVDYEYSKWYNVYKFVIESDGTVSNAEVMQGIGNEYNKEALRVVQMMPRWTPSRFAGSKTPIRSQYAVPIKIDFE